MKTPVLQPLHATLDRRPAKAHGGSTGTPLAGKRSSAGFTLLEMLVAGVIMAVAVVGLLSALSTSMRNAARLRDYDVVTLLARRTMDELLADRTLPKDQVLEGRFESTRHGIDGGWVARITDFELPAEPRPGIPVLERIQLEVWWTSGTDRRSLTLEGYRRSILPFASPAAQ